MADQTWQTFTVEDFLAAFGAPADDRALIAEEVAKYDFGWRRLTQGERDAAVLSILKKLDGFTKVGEHRHGIWTDSWEETHQRYLKSGRDIEALDPPFMGATPIIRLSGDYAIPRDPAFEHHWFRVYRQWMFKKFVGGSQRFLEFGCGSGFNLATIGKLRPDLELTGFDWAQPAVDLVNQVADDHKLKLSGRRFDYFNLDKSVNIGPGATIGTFCSLEQTGTRYKDFFNWLMEAKPDLVISMEPGIENYDTDTLYDYMGYAYVAHRQYLNGYFSDVRDAAKQGRAEILWDRRPGFGSFYHEGYSLIVWRPL
jgi:SAM-dependent methyltransferase